MRAPSRWRALFVCVYVAVLLAVPTIANAHMLNMTKVSIDVAEDGPSTVTLMIDLGQSLLTPQRYWELAAQPSERQVQTLAATLAILSEQFAVLADDERQTLILQDWSLPASSLEAVTNPLTPQMATLTYSVNLSGKSELELVLGESLEIPWPCLLRVDTVDTPLPISRLLTDSWRSSRTVSLTGTAQSSTPLDATLVASLSSWLPEVTWVVIGFQHILPKGFDHILFVLGLLLVATSRRSLFWQVSAFTLAHSLTLMLAALGTVAIPASVVEPLIALSIVYIGLEYLYPGKPPWLRFSIVFVFGLLHGLGFADALSALYQPTENVWAALLAFNLGIEFGQLAVLALAFGAMRWFVSRPWYAGMIAQPASITISGIGMYWFLSRIIY